MASSSSSTTLPCHLLHLHPFTIWSWTFKKKRPKLLHFKPSLLLWLWILSCFKFLCALFVNGVAFSEVFAVGFTTFCSHLWAPWKHFMSNTSFQLSKEIVQLSFELHNVYSSTKAYLNPTMSQQLSEQSSKISYFEG